MQGTSETLTRAEIVEAIHGEIGLARVDAQRMVEAILASISDALADGQNVKVSGFGTFLLHDKSARVGRNPKTGTEAQITARRVVTFRPSESLKGRIAKISVAT